MVDGLAPMRFCMGSVISSMLRCIVRYTGSRLLFLGSFWLWSRVRLHRKLNSWL